MKDKPFKSVHEQIEILESRNLVFLDKENAKKILYRYGYYEIINGYKDFLLENDTDSEEDVYSDDSTFEHIYALFSLDKEIRNSVLTATLEIECSLRSALAYVISETYGHKENDYLVRTNYKSGIGRKSTHNGR